MHPCSLFLLCFGLGLGHGCRTGCDPPPKPSLSIWPSSFVLPGSNVTLRCQAPIRDVRFVFRKSKQFQHSTQSPDATESKAEFSLMDVQHSDSGEYTCEYSRRGSSRSSPPSDVVLLLVTGNFPKPSLQVHVRPNVTAGETVTLDCKQFGNADKSLHFALLKEGTSKPIKVQSQERRKAQFLLQNVSVSDSGKYSCAYFQSAPPFWASHISDHLEIWVTESRTQSPTTTPPQTGDNGGARSNPRAGETLGIIGIISLTVIFTLLFLLLSAFCIYRYTRCGAACNKMTKSSNSPKEREELVADAPEAVKDSLPALADGSQASNAEDLQAVTYAELDTRALRQAPSDLSAQPPDNCVYSSVKT